MYKEFCNFGKVQPLNWRKIGVRQIGGGCGGREGGWCRISAAVGQKGGWKIFKFNSSFMRIRHSWSNLNIWRFNGKRPIKKVTEFAHFLVKHENTKNTEVCGLSDFSRMHCELLLLHKLMKIKHFRDHIFLQNFNMNKIFASKFDAKIRFCFLLDDILMFHQNFNQNF